MHAGTVRALRELLETLARVRLAFLPKALQRLPRLSAALDGVNIWIKRDDVTGLALGGNKVRSLEFLMADALSRAADVIVTRTAAQSNMLRLTNSARQLG